MRRINSGIFRENFVKWFGFALGVVHYFVLGNKGLKIGTTEKFDDLFRKEPERLNVVAIRNNFGFNLTIK